MFKTNGNMSHSKEELSFMWLRMMSSKKYMILKYEIWKENICGLNIFHSGIKYTEKVWVQVKV